MVCGRERAEIFFRELEEPNRWAQTPPVFGVRRLLEIFLEMNERTCRLDQSFKKIIIIAVGVEPNLFKDIVRFVVTLFVPASKISAIKRMIRDLTRKGRLRRSGCGDGVASEVAHKPRNSFAFVHEAFNFTMPLMMGKPTFPEGNASFRCHDHE